MSSLARQQPPASGSGKGRLRLRAALIAAGAGIGVLILLKAFVADIWRIESVSMEPALRAGERVLVRYTTAPPQRGDLVVVMLPGDRDPRVKRVGAVGGEYVRIAGGDLLVDGKSRRATVAPPVLVCDNESAPLAELFPGAPWRDGALDGRGQRQEACYRGRMSDAAPGSRDDQGLRQVGDGVLEVEIEASEARLGASWTLALTEQGDRFEARVTLAEKGWEARLMREREGAWDELLAWPPGGAGAAGSGPDGSAAGGRWSARFSNIDNTLRLQLEPWGLPPIDLRCVYEANTPLLDSPDPTATHRRPRACITIEGALLHVRSLRLLRDVHYTDAGQWATASPVQLGPEELFLLGDNSAESEDSRMWGALPVSAVVGRPVAVVWPPSGWRKL